MRKTIYPRTHLTPKAKSFLYTPIEFRVKQQHSYPEDNKHEFERWFHDNTAPDEITGKVYLPIFWTAYWTNNGYGAKEKSRNNLQRFIDSLPRDKKYFTICQYDDGPMVDFKDLDITVFGMSGGRIDYPIPLLCQPHGYKFNCERDIFASFVGGDTHPIRRELVKQLTGKQHYQVSLKKMPLKEYCNILARSTYVLCPRGYGKSSFRIQEAIHYGAIPVYISDSFVVPYNIPFTDYGMCYHPENSVGITIFLEKLHTEFYYEKLEGLKNISHLYTYEGCKQRILQEVNK